MNRIVLITGATSGIGKATAEQFAKEKDHLIITGRRQEKLSLLAEGLRNQYHIRVLDLCFDVRDKEAVMKNLTTLPDEWKQIDILVNNAGLALGRESFQDASLEDMETMMQTNVNGLIYVTKAIIHLMIDRQKGHIINIGSIAGKEVYANGNAYCGSKFAVDALSKSMRIDFLKHGIKVTAIHPGAVETEFSLVRFKGDASKATAVYDGYIPLTGEDIAGTISYVVNLPAHICINEMIVTCQQQANAHHLHKTDNHKTH